MCVKHDFPFCDQEDYEASMPPVVEEPPPQEQARTPTIKPLPKTPTSKSSLSKTPVQKTPLQKPPKVRIVKMICITEYMQTILKET